jgi:Zn-dependent protease/predicted transcriptional regulator
MFGRRIKIFTLAGFEVGIDLSWIIIAVLIVWSLAAGVFPYYLPYLPEWQYWVMGVLGAIGLFASVVFHELCHSLVARRFGMNMSGITLFVFGGVAEMTDEPKTARAEFFMAIAGPLASLLFALLFYGIAYAGKISLWPHQVLLVLNYIWTINLLLAIFNLIPAFPLDGGRVLRSIFWYWKKDIIFATRVTTRIGSAFGILLILLGVISIFTGALVSAIWWILIGLFIRNAANASYDFLLMRQALEGEIVSRFVTDNIEAVPPQTPLSSFLNDYIDKYHSDIFPVLDGDTKIAKCATINSLKGMSGNELKEHTVNEIAGPCTPDNYVFIDDKALDVLMKVNKTGNGRFIVVNHDWSLAGVVNVKDIMRFVAVRTQLK